MSSSSRDSGDDATGETVLARGSYDGSGDERLSTTILQVLDSMPDFDVASTDDVLAARVDPDALDALFATTDRLPRDQGKVVFPIDAYWVTVTASGEIRVTARE